MHTKDILAAELRKAGLNAMADKAAAGYYHDYLSPLDMPCQQLAHDLKIFADAPSLSEPRRVEARTLLARHLNGEFDASKEESEAWAASPEGRETFAKLTPDRRRAKKAADTPTHTLGDAPIEEAYHAEMIAIAGALDQMFNGDAKAPDKKTGFVLLVFPFGDEEGGRTNFISNGADRRDIVVLFKEMIARFEGQPETSGRA
jgi:hypothetical protein